MHIRDDLLARLTAVEQPILQCIHEENQYLPGEYETAHNTGRWCEAALLMQHTTGMAIPERMERAVGLHLRAFTNNPYGLLLNDPETLGSGRLNYHNLREALLSYAACIEYRNSRWAVACAEKLLDTINRRFFEKTLSDEEICQATGTCISPDPMLVPPPDDVYGDADYTTTIGRAIEGMYRYWKLTQSPLALEVMQKTVAFHRTHTLCADGSTPAWMKDSFHVGHNHSYLGTLRGLLLYALEFHDMDLIQTIFQTYKTSIPKYNCDATGFAPHDLAKLSFPDTFGDPQGDPASCADAIYIAFLLATQGGHPELLDDAERWMRCRLFHSQIDSEKGYGAWGIYLTYWGQGNIIDVFASIASTLCRIYDSMIEERGQDVYIHLLFSANHSSLCVQAERDDRQHIRIIPNCAKNIHLRIPAWAPEESIHIADHTGRPIVFHREGMYIIIPENTVEIGKAIDAAFDLPTYETTTQTWISRQKFSLKWKGDAITEITSPQTEIS